MTIDPEQTTPRDFYRHMIGCITPRPIAWVSSISPSGVPNLAPFSFFNGIGANPPAVVFSPLNGRDGRPKDTVLNIEATGQFVVNVVSAALAKPMNDTSAELPYETSEFAAFGITPLPSVRVPPPRVAESPAQMECELLQIVHVGTGPMSANLVIGRVVLLHLADRVLDPSGQIDPQLLDTIGRLGGNNYTHTRDRIAMTRPGLLLKPHRSAARPSDSAIYEKTVRCFTAALCLRATHRGGRQ